MKKSSYLAIIAVVILLHLCLFWYLMHTPGKKRSPVEKPAVPEQEMPPASAGGDVLPDATAAGELDTGTNAENAVPSPSGAWPEFLPYHDGYFVETAPQTPMPAALQEQLKMCRSGVAVDLDSHEIFWAKNASAPMPIASLTKMLTALNAVRKLYASNGAITLETPIQVTRQASKIGGRQVWLDPKETFLFDEILKCVMVHSANDAAYLLAQFCGGGDAGAFLAEMDQYARSLGCRSFHLVNVHGLPEKELNDENAGSPLELAYLAECLQKVPEVMKWTGVRTATLRENHPDFLAKHQNKPTLLQSSNHLLGTCAGVNGMKTGLTNKAGSCIVVTCERQNRRMCVVLLGCKEYKKRDGIARQMLEWLYRQ